MTVTMRDIAKMANVSRPVVCSVLGGKSTCRVSEEKRKLILDLVKEYGYQPNQHASSLRSGKTKTVGLLFPSFRDRIIGEIMDELYCCLRDAGYSALISVWKSLDELESVYKSIMGRKVDGLITCEYRKEFNTENIPTVVYYNHTTDADVLAIDYDTAFREAAEYLGSMGHRKFGYIGPANNRYESCCRAFSQFEELNITKTHHESGFAESGVTGARALLADRADHPSAILCHNDSIALAALAEAQRMGYVIGEDLSIVGLDNSRESTISSCPALTTIDTFTPKKARIMTDMLLERMNDPDKPFRTVTLETKLVIRESCGPCKKTNSNKEKKK